jgi:oligopeptide transport system permease protein
MLTYILQRLLWLVPVLFVIAVITFTLMHLVPGGPWDTDRRLPEAAEENLNERYGLDKSLPEQFADYMTGLVQGDLGVSYRSLNRPVRDIIWDGAQVSFTLGLLALAVSVAVGVPLGIVAALRQNTAIDYASVGFVSIGASLPSFVSGMLLLVVFSAQLHWLPTSGWGSPEQAIMPVIALSILPAAYIARVTRASMLEVLHQDYIRTARAKGLREQAIVMRHVVRNGLIPVLTVIGPIGAALVTGSFIIESLFAIPGIGRTFVTSIAARDYGVIMGTTLFYAVLVVLFNLVVDVLYFFVDPRIRYR